MDALLMALDQPNTLIEHLIKCGIQIGAVW